MKKILATAGAVALSTAALAGTAGATTHTAGPTFKPAPYCKGTVIHDHLNKTDNGHGSPSEWANLSFSRTVVIAGKWDRDAQTCRWVITLTDRGGLKTIKNAGNPNGTGTPIANVVPGTFTGVYHLTAEGARKNVHPAGTGSTAYVQSLFTGKVTSGAYTWTYRTVCGEHWVDSSANDDGQGAAAGSITGKTCRACHKPPYHHSPKPTPTVTVTPTTPVPTPTDTVPATQPGDAAPAQPVSGQPSFTG